MVIDWFPVLGPIEKAGSDLRNIVVYDHKHAAQRLPHLVSRFLNVTIFRRRSRFGSRRLDRCFFAHRQQAVRLSIGWDTVVHHTPCNDNDDADHRQEKQYAFHGLPLTRCDSSSTLFSQGDAPSGTGSAVHPTTRRSLCSGLGHRFAMW